jgi:hypothetical protein
VDLGVIEPPLRTQEEAAMDALPKVLDEIERMRQVALRIQQAALRGDRARISALAKELLRG